MAKKLTQEEWIINAQKTHQKRYDYSLVEYKNSHCNVKIICNKCNILFIQTAYSHVQGNGCPNLCWVLEDKRNKFILKANKIHDNKYDYSLVDYKHSNSKVDIICSIHGVFSQTPHNHLSHRGCQKCHIDRLATINKLNTEQFIEKAKLVHKNKYSYDKVIYKDNESKVYITCSIHGDFLISPHNFLAGANCLKCSKQIIYKKVVKPLEEFIKDAINIHGNKYDYSLVEYVSNKVPVVLKCKYHNFLFTVRPDSHLFNKSGCPKCTNSGTSKSEKSLLSWLNSLGYNFKPSTIPGSRLRLDMYDKNLGIAIEYNGTYWHSTKHKQDDYHLNKYTLCKEKGITLIHVFEFENMFKWKRRLFNYLKDPSNYTVSFSNNKRVINKTYICYGQSYIKRKQNQC